VRLPACSTMLRSTHSSPEHTWSSGMANAGFWRSIKILHETCWVPDFGSIAWRTGDPSSIRTATNCVFMLDSPSVSFWICASKLLILCTTALWNIEGLPSGGAGPSCGERLEVQGRCQAEGRSRARRARALDFQSKSTHVFQVAWARRVRAHNSSLHRPGPKFGAQGYREQKELVYL
jgi:hypothetical protein